MLSQSVAITANSALGNHNEMRSNSMAMSGRRRDKSQQDINQRVDLERRSFVGTIMNELNKRVEQNHQTEQAKLSAGQAKADGKPLPEEGSATKREGSQEKVKEANEGGESAKKKMKTKKASISNSAQKSSRPLDGSRFKPGSLAGKDSKYQSTFLGLTRDQYFDMHIKNPVQCPPPAAYRPKYSVIDP